MANLLNTLQMKLNLKNITGATLGLLLSWAVANGDLTKELIQSLVNDKHSAMFLMRKPGDALLGTPMVYSFWDSSYNLSLAVTDGMSIPSPDGTYLVDYEKNIIHNLKNGNIHKLPDDVLAPGIYIKELWYKDEENNRYLLNIIDSANLYHDNIAESYIIIKSIDLETGDYAGEPIISYPLSDIKTDELILDSASISPGGRLIALNVVSDYDPGGFTAIYDNVRGKTLFINKGILNVIFINDRLLSLMGNESMFIVDEYGNVLLEYKNNKEHENYYYVGIHNSFGNKFIVSKTTYSSDLNELRYDLIEVTEEGLIVHSDFYIGNNIDSTMIFWDADGNFGVYNAELRTLDHYEVESGKPPILIDSHTIDEEIGGFAAIPHMQSYRLFIPD